jgi:hypothetical protein
LTKIAADAKGVAKIVPESVPEFPLKLAFHLLKTMARIRHVCVIGGSSTVSQESPVTDAEVND